MRNARRTRPRRRAGVASPRSPFHRHRAPRNSSVRFFCRPRVLFLPRQMRLKERMPRREMMARLFFARYFLFLYCPLTVRHVLPRQHNAAAVARFSRRDGASPRAAQSAGNQRHPQMKGDAQQATRDDVGRGSPRREFRDIEDTKVEEVSASRRALLPLTLRTGFHARCATPAALLRNNADDAMLFAFARPVCKQLFFERRSARRTASPHDRRYAPR